MKDKAPMKNVVTTAVLVACLFTISLESHAETSHAQSQNGSPPSVWSMQRIGEPVRGGIAEYTFGLALSPDHQRIATLGDRLRIWDAGTGKPIGEPLNIFGQAVAWSPDGSIVASGTNDGRVVLSDAGTNHILWQTGIGKKAVTVLAFSPDGKRIAASNDSDNTVRILNAEGKEVCQAQPAHLKTVTGLTFAEGGKTLVSASLDSTIRMWDPETCKELRPHIESKNGFFRMLALHPGGSVVAVAAREGPTVNDRNGGVEFWDISSGQMVAAPLKGYGGTYGIGGLAFSEGGDTLMVADSSGSLALINWKTGKLLARGVADHDAVIVWRTIFSPKGNLVATAGKDRVLGIWSTHVTSVSASPLALLSSKAYTFDGALPTFSGNGKTVAFTREKHVVVRDNGSNEELLDVALKEKAYRIALSSDGQLLVVYDRHVHLWHVPTKRRIGEWDYFNSESFAFNANSTRLAVGAFSSVFLIDCVSGKEIARYQIGVNPHNPRVLRLAFDPTDRLLFATTEEGDVHRFDTTTLKPVGDPWRGINRYGALAFSADGGRVATSRRLPHGDSMQVVVLEAASGAQLAGPMEENMGWEQTLAFTPDGNHLLMAGGNGTVSLWDSASGQRLARVTSGSQSALRGIQFTRDLQRLYACDMGTYTRTDCQSWAVSFHAPSTAASTRAPTSALATLSPVGDVSHIAIGSLSNTIDFRTNELNVRPEKGLLVFQNAGIAWLHSATENNGNAVTLYADSSLSSDRGLVTVPLEDGQLAIFNFRTGKLLNVMDTGGIHAFLSDGTLAFDRGPKGILIVDPKTGRELRTLAYPIQDRVSVLAAGRKRPTVVIGTTDGTLLVGHLDSPSAPFKVLKNTHRGRVVTVAISDDERLAASGGLDGRIQLFDMQTGSAVGAPWAAHGNAVTAIGFNSDNSLVASGSTDGTIRIWNVRTGQPVTNALVAHTEPVLAVAFDSSNGQVLSFGRDYKLRNWSLRQMPGKQ